MRERDRDLRDVYPADGLTEEQRAAVAADMRRVGAVRSAPAPLPPARSPSYGLWQATGIPPWRIQDYARGAWEPEPA